MKENNECIEVVLQETYLDLAPAIASDYIKINLNIQFHFLEFRNMYINCFHHFLATNNLTVDCDVSGSAAHAV